MTIEDSNLVRHAETELARAGLFDQDSDYDGDVANKVMDLIKLFAEQRHSGGSAYLTLHLFDQLSKFQTLNALTNDPAEWIDHEQLSPGVWQSRRQSDAFSEDGGLTYYVLTEERKWTTWPIISAIPFFRRRDVRYPIHTSEPA